MKILRKFIYGILLITNAIVGLGYLLCAYSPYVHPVSHPYWASFGLFIPIFITLNFLFLLFWLIIKWKYALVPIAIFLLGWGGLRSYMPINLPRKASSEKVIKVLTYNVEGFHSDNTDVDNPILDYLNKSNADIICLQEFITGWQVSEDKVNAALSEYPYHKITRLRGGDGLACYSRFPILSEQRIAYESNFNGSILYRLRIGEDTVTLVNNHLESNKLTTQDKEMYRELITSPHENTVKTEGRHLLQKLADAMAIRAPQADSVSRAIRESDARHLIVCGDFNDSPVSYAHRIIGQGLNDAFIKAGFGPGFTYNKDWLYFRIDHMFVSKSFRVIQCEVDRSIDSSDHYPMWCLLERKD